MSNVLFYTHNKEDLKRVIRMVVEEIRKTEMISNTPISPEEDRLTQKEAAKFLGISVTTLISWKKKGLISYFQVGRPVFFSKTEFLEAARKNPGLIKPSRK
ncbi:helix-turn-helix domain-containing protein [Sinomicrobium sp. FJxs]|uniref:Helix-turn-helix domain-containing protein n=2 Tax=Sinomicrobium weinanense TaxID=2842200 RepID=A0A926Q127_9FLAO|nr:helix-turn-helix domain-containing protein [Sinomicrobium weinanense]MBU3123952.1 helix-turn-helix domain-containing protein [Sinomicrobium weinanense]